MYILVCTAESQAPMPFEFTSSCKKRIPLKSLSFYLYLETERIFKHQISVCIAEKKERKIDFRTGSA